VQLIENTSWRGKICKIDLLALTSNQLVFLLKVYFLFFCNTSYLKSEVNCTEPSLTVRTPCNLQSNTMSLYYVRPVEGSTEKENKSRLSKKDIKFCLPFQWHRLQYTQMVKNMDILKLTGQNLGRVFNSRCGNACECHEIALTTKSRLLEWKVLHGDERSSFFLKSV